MIGRGFLRAKTAEVPDSMGFDTFELRLGDLMRGERATMGKSLLDVQRELKIKSAYIAAIEKADPTAFDTPGFIAGYVRSYARYLNMDPDWAFDTFCRESGFATAHGMSAAASSTRPERSARTAASGLGKDLFSAADRPFLPVPTGFLSTIEPRALGSVLVLVALLGGLSYGGWMVLREVQKVSFAPVEQPPTVIAEMDPLAGGLQNEAEQEVASLAVPSAEALDRLYRPRALDVPVLVPRDGPIASLDPRAVRATPSAPSGALPNGSNLAAAVLPAPADGGTAGAVSGPDIAAVLGTVVPSVQVYEGPAPEVQLVATREAWVRVSSADGSVLFEGILAPGDTFDVPATQEPPTLRVGESGALFMALNGVPHGPVGPSGSVSSNVPLSAEAISATYAVADLTQDAVLADYVAVAQAQPSAAALPPGAVLPGTVLPGEAAAAPD